MGEDSIEDEEVDVLGDLTEAVDVTKVLTDSRG